MFLSMSWKQNGKLVGQLNIKSKFNHIKILNKLKHWIAASNLGGRPLPTELLTNTHFKAEDLNWFFLLMYILFWQIHSEELEQEKELTLTCMQLWVEVWGLQGFHYSCSAPPLLSCDMPASLHIWQQCSIAECTSSIGQWAAREAVITVPLFCWSAQQPHKRKWNVPALILEGVMYHEYCISIQSQGKVATDARTDWDLENLEVRSKLQTASCFSNHSWAVYL